MLNETLFTSFFLLDILPPALVVEKTIHLNGIVITQNKLEKLDLADLWYIGVV